MAEKKSRGKVAETVYGLARPVVEGLGLSLWDVDFFREGAEYDLLVTVDRPGGAVGLEDCEAVSRALSPLLDEADPIEESYCLEVSSAGLGRELVRPEHFRAFLGKPVLVKLYAPRNGKKSAEGTLKAFGADGSVTLLSGGEEISLRRDEIAKCTVADLDF
ncbi:MAG: ribosome maturation factor RimP [Clostridia bacterium]|nr:ribosome maturation factor RimP [Clostridia bacterium]